MKIGKISESVLKRSVFKQIKHRRDEVLVSPGVGKDCALIELAPDEVMVLSTDPITGTANQIGKLAEMCPSTPQERERMSRIPYASAIESIMYAMICTHPDVSYALSMTSRHQVDPR